MIAASDGQAGPASGEAGAGEAALEATGEAARRRRGDLVRRVLTGSSPAWCLLVLGLLGMAGAAAMFCAVLLCFHGSWSRVCDYQLKVWCVVWLCTLISQMVCLISATALRMFDKEDAVKGVQIFKFVLDLFNFCWWLYGIKPVLVDPKCDSVSSRWGLGLWFLQLAKMTLSCLFLCTLVCLFTIMFRHRDYYERAVEVAPTPPDVLKQLHVVKWQEVKSRLLDLPPSTPSSAPPLRSRSGPNIVTLTNNIVALTGLPLPDAPGLRRMQSARASQGLLRSSTSLLSARPPVATLGRALSSKPGGLACPICFFDFEDEDEVVLMPCDQRHVFHLDCVTSWLEKSQACPMCRANIVETMRASGEAGGASGAAAASASAGAPETSNGMGHLEIARPETPTAPKGGS